MARHTRVLLPAIGTALLAFGLHLFYLRGSLLSDEGGFAMVARWWGAPGGELYGAQWVDRPPGLIVVFWIANLLGSDGPRLMAGIIAAIFVLAAAWAGWEARGAPGARWAMLVGLFLVTTPVTQTFALNGELIASTWTMIAVASSLAVVRRPGWNGTAAPAALLAGAAAAAALLTKQNFADAAVFVGVLGLGHLLIQPRDRSRLLASTGLVVTGFVLPAALTLAWAATHSSVGELIYALYGFRVDAARVMSQWSMAPARERRTDLVGIAIGSGLVPIALALVVAGRRKFRRPSPLLVAALAAGAIELVGVVGGGNYWAHYLIGLSPMIVLAVAVLAPNGGRAARMVRVQVAVAAAVALVMTPIAGHVAADTSTVARVGSWVKQAAHHDDTAVVLYSHANVLGVTGLRPTYPYAWSLPVRTRDPQLATLAATLTAPSIAPTWVIGWDDLTSWGLDADRRIAEVLATHYRRVATVCSRPVWLHAGVNRSVPPDPCDRALNLPT